MTTAIIDTSTANIASVRFALERLDADYHLVRDPDETRDLERLILPGVGAAKPAMKTLTERGWDKALQEENRPILGVCLGMQLLFDYSDESDIALLGLIPGRVEKLRPGTAGPWPHMGWNELTNLSTNDPLLQGIEEDQRVYFVHGFYVAPGPYTIAQTHYGLPITAMSRKANVSGCQFHPERSASVGSRILKNFLEIPG